MGGPGAHKTGRTPGGAAFRVPVTPDMFVTLSRPRHWGPAEAFTLTIMAANLATLLAARWLPLAVYVANFAAWRTAYNVGLGVVLTAQSERRSVTRWLAAAPPGTKDLVRWVVTRSLPPDYRWSRCPLEFNAWIAFRALSMVVLANDGLTYLVLAAAVCAKGLRPASGVLELLVSVALGAALCVFSFWSKAAAHDCVGDFAWYWGDFFFVMEGEITFAGVYELFPHPMYTVGYSAYYGISLLTRSYTLLFVSLMAHAGQIAFLLIVEEPHIQKIYGSAEDSASPSAVSAAARAAAAGLDPSGLVGVRRPVTARAGDAGLVALLLSTAALFALGRPSALAAAVHLLAWRAAQWGGLGSVLRSQAHGGGWVAAAQAAGVSPAAAFEAWKQMWNGVWTLNHALFVVTAFYIAPNPYAGLSDLLSAVGISHVLGGVALVCIALAALDSSFHALDGAYGFFYTDFFLPSLPSSPLPSPSSPSSPASSPAAVAPGTTSTADYPDNAAVDADVAVDAAAAGAAASAAAAPPVACYKGVYRYVNNPECVLGYLLYYGIAVMLKSWTVCALAFACQAMHAAFVVLVEMPHLERTHAGVRGRAALERTLRSHAARVADAVPVVGKIRDEVTLRAVRSKSLLTSQGEKVVSARDLLLDRKEQLVSEVSSLNVRLREHRLYLRAVEIQQEARAKFQEFDGGEIVAALERRGVQIECASEFGDEEGDECDAAAVAELSPPAARTKKRSAAVDESSVLSTLSTDVGATTPKPVST